MMVELGLVELTERSDTLNYKSFFKHCILQTILHIFFIVYIFVEKKYLVLKTELYFRFF